MHRSKKATVAELSLALPQNVGVDKFRTLQLLEAEIGEANLAEAVASPAFITVVCADTVSWALSHTHIIKNTFY